MKKVKIITDTTNDLDLELLEKRDIDFIPLYVNFQDDFYKDLLEINSDKLYEKVDLLGYLPKTSAPAPQDFYNSFKPYLDKGYEIVYIGLSSQLSASLQNSNIARSSLEGSIEILDSLNVSAGLGLLSLEAADLRDKGLAAREIREELELLVEKTHTNFIIDSFDYLKKGGRCSSIQSFIGGALNIKPIIHLRNGRIEVKKKLRGKKEKLIKAMLDEVLENIESLDHKRFFIVHSQAQEIALEVKDILEEKAYFKDLIICSTGSVTSSHCGPGSLGLAYRLK